MLIPQVTPQVIFGSPSTGAGSDSFRRALGKFNSHTHSESSYSSFFSHPLVLGSSVSTVTDEDQYLFLPGAMLVSYTGSELTLSSPAIRSSESGTLTIGSVQLTGLICTVGSAVVKKVSRAGFVHPSTVEAASTKIITGRAYSSVPFIYPILLSPTTDLVISRFCYQLITGNAFLTLETDSRVIHTLDTSTTFEKTVDFSVSSTSNPRVNKDSSFGIKFSSISGLTEVFYTAYLIPSNYSG